MGSANSGKTTWQQIAVAEPLIPQFCKSFVELLGVDGQLEVVDHDLTAIDLCRAQHSHPRLPRIRLIELLQHVLNHSVVDALRVCNER